MRNPAVRERGATPCNPVVGQNPRVRYPSRRRCDLTGVIVRVGSGTCGAPEPDAARALLLICTRGNANTETARSGDRSGAPIHGPNNGQARVILSGRPSPPECAARIGD